MNKSTISTAVSHRAELQLSSLSDCPCHFSHENTDDAEPRQCSVRLQESRLGCVHSAQVVLQETITLLELHSPTFTEGRSYRERIRTLMIQLGRLDIQASSQYEIHRHALTKSDTANPEIGLENDAIESEQETVVELAAIRDALLGELQKLR